MGRRRRYTRVCKVRFTPCVCIALTGSKSQTSRKQTPFFAVGCEEPSVEYFDNNDIAAKKENECQSGPRGRTWGFPMYTVTRTQTRDPWPGELSSSLATLNLNFKLNCTPGMNPQDPCTQRPHIS